MAQKQIPLRQVVKILNSQGHNIEYRNNFRSNLMVNVSVLNEEYKLNYKPFEFYI